jgi:hypothetical protein
MVFTVPTSQRAAVPVFIDGTKRDIVGWAFSDEEGMHGYSRQGRKPLAYVVLYRAKYKGRDRVVVAGPAA